MLARRSGSRWSRCRLRRADFERARVSGIRVGTRLFISLLVHRADGAPARLGITVTRKVGNAVRRNRIKRLVREWFRLRHAGLGACDVIVIAKRDMAAQLDCRGVVRDLDGAWQRLQACRP